MSNRQKGKFPWTSWAQLVTRFTPAYAGNILSDQQVYQR